MSFLLFETVLRLIRRQPRPQPIVHIDCTDQVAKALPSLGQVPEPDLALLFANGRAAAERQQQVLNDPTAAKPRPTKFTAKCLWCLEPFDREPRTDGELEKLRQVLLTPGYAATAKIDICDPCYENALASAIPVNGHTGLLDIGGDNHGPGNLLLRKFHNSAA